MGYRNRDDIMHEIAENNVLAAKMRLDYQEKEKAIKNRFGIIDAICLGTGIVLGAYLLSGCASYQINPSRKTLDSKLPVFENKMQNIYDNGLLQELKGK